MSTTKFTYKGTNISDLVTSGSSSISSTYYQGFPTFSTGGTLSTIENDLNRRSKQIQDSFDKNVGIAKNVSDIGGMALTNLSKGFNAKSPTRGIL